jgi:hypothetical protein
MARKIKEPRQLAFDEMVRTPQATVSFAIVCINGGRGDAVPHSVRFRD